MKTPSPKKKTPRITAAVFDVDGMLLNTKEFIFQAFEDTLLKFGHQVPDRATISRQIGRSLQDCYTSLAPNGDVVTLCEAHGIFQNTPAMIKLITAYPDTVEMLETLQAHKIKLAVFSSRKLTLVSSLQQAGIADFFQVIVQGDEVTRHKPHPEGLFKALNGLEVAGHQAAMIGDAAVDILAGKAAEVALTIGITHGFGTRQELEDAKPDYIVDYPIKITDLLLGPLDRS